MGANILLFVCSNILGAIDFYIADRRQRRSVLETRQSLEVKITLESENRQQVCYLPTYAADLPSLFPREKTLGTKFPYFLVYKCRLLCGSP